VERALSQKLTQREKVEPDQQLFTFLVKNPGKNWGTPPLQEQWREGGERERVNLLTHPSHRNKKKKRVSTGGQSQKLEKKAKKSPLGYIQKRGEGTIPAVLWHVRKGGGNPPRPGQFCKTGKRRGPTRAAEKEEKREYVGGFLVTVHLEGKEARNNICHARKKQVPKKKKKK